MWKRKFKYEDQTADAGGGTGGGAAASGGDNGQAQAAGAGAQAGAADHAGQPASVLAGAAQGQAQASGFDWIPEKHRVAKEDGSIDIEASFKKNAEAYGKLEQRFGSGDVPPKTAEEYEPKLEGDELKDFDAQAFMADEGTKGFLKGAHAKGMTNAQVSYVLSEYAKIAPKLMQGQQAITQDQAVEQLKSEWKTNAEYEGNLSSAFKAFNAFAADGDKAKIDEIGNNPIVIRLLANIGKEMKEDTAPGGDGGMGTGGDSIEKLMSSEAYWNEKHPDHKATSEKVASHYKAKFGTKAVF